MLPERQISPEHNFNPERKVVNPGVLHAAYELRAGLAAGSLPELDYLTSNLATQVYANDPEISPIGFYKELRQYTPVRIKSDLEHRLFGAIRSEDRETSSMGKRVMLYLRIRSALTAAEGFLTGDQEFDSELIQAGIGEYFEEVENYVPNNKHNPVRVLVKRGIKTHLANLKTHEVTLENAQTLQTDDDFREIELKEVRALITVMLDSLSSRQRFVIKKRTMEGLPLSAVGKLLLSPVGRARTRQIEKEALRRLRMPYSAGRMRKYFDGEGQIELNRIDTSQWDARIFTERDQWEMETYRDGLD